LAKLGEQYALPNLKQQVSDVLSPCLEQLPSLACVAYNLVDIKTTPELHAAALDVLRKKPYQAFVKGPGGEIGGIPCLSPDKLDTVFRDQEVNAQEIFLFQCLQDWKATNADLYANTDQICRMVAQNLDFSAMNASDIEEIVLPSGLVDSGSLVSGLMTVAKAAEKRGISLRSSRRKTKAPRTSAAADSGSSINSGSAARAPRGRRFKKLPVPAGDDDTYADASHADDRREDIEPAPVPVVQAPAPHTQLVKKSRKPNSFTSRASKFLGGFGALRGQSVKESDLESESVDGPLSKTPTYKDTLERNTSHLEETVAGEEIAKAPTKERVKEIISNE